VSVMTLSAFGQVFYPFVQPTTERMDSCIEPDEIRVLLTLVQSFKPETFLEIGTCRGGTAARILAQSSSIKRYVAVDYVDARGNSSMCQPEEIGMRAKGDSRYSLIVSPEGSGCSRLEKLEPDMVFIDGNHDYSWCLHDSLLAHRITKQGGVIIWHDFHTYHPGVNKTIYELNEAKDRIVWVRDTSVCFEIVHDKDVLANGINET